VVHHGIDPLAGMRRGHQPYRHHRTQAEETRWRTAKPGSGEFTKAT
jgi:hypothetical protein